MVHAAKHVENNTGSEADITSGSKNKAKKMCFRWYEFVMITFQLTDCVF